VGGGGPRRRRAPARGCRACLTAGRRVAEGSVGAGTGATVGKLFGLSRAMKGGIGTASLSAGALRVGALAVVNAFGDVQDPETGRLVAGARASARSMSFSGTEALLRAGARPAQAPAPR